MIMIDRDPADYKNLNYEIVSVVRETDHASLQAEEYLPSILFAENRLHAESKPPLHTMDVRGFRILGAGVTFDMSLGKMLPPMMRRVLALGVVGLREAEIESILHLDEGVVTAHMNSLLAITHQRNGTASEWPGLASALITGSSPLTYLETTVRNNIFADCSSNQLHLTNLRSQGRSYGEIGELLDCNPHDAQAGIVHIMEQLEIPRETLLTTLYALTLRTYPIYGIALDDILPGKQLPGFEA